ncbi:hypothetical protein TNCV_4305831 [Trichonephila clavipes]|nr:hypothetical protein TNCV_4305831 [Trichonephila clavipes]
MDVSKCIVLSLQGGTLNIRRVGSPLVRLVEGEERCVCGPLTTPQGVLAQDLGGTKPNRTVTCMMFKATDTTGLQLTP